MSEVINVVVALAVIVFVVRWATSSSETPEEKNVRRALGFRPKKVTSEMTETIANMFPDLPRENIHYDLLRSGSVETTTNKIIERGYLEAPPAGYFRIYPRTSVPNQPTNQQPAPPRPTNANANNHSPATSASSFATPTKPSAPSLITRYKLEERLRGASSAQVGAGVGVGVGVGVGAGEMEMEIIDAPEKAGGKATWEATPERREASLRERKAQMVLAARKRMLEQQKAARLQLQSQSSGAGPSSSSSSASASGSGLKVE